MFRAICLVKAEKNIFEGERISLTLQGEDLPCITLLTSLTSNTSKSHVLQEGLVCVFMAGLFNYQQATLDWF